MVRYVWIIEMGSYDDRDKVEVYENELSAIKAFEKYTEGYDYSKSDKREKLPDGATQLMSRHKDFGTWATLTVHQVRGSILR